MFILVYVDDILVTSNDSNFLKEFTSKLNSVFALKDLGSLYYFLRIEVRRDSSGFYLNQGIYILNVLKRFGMINCGAAATPMVTGSKFSTNDGEKMVDPTLYRRVIGSLQYLLNTRPDIAFSINKLSQFLLQPRGKHFQGVKRIFR